ncbi:MAG: trypsin-like serine protease [Myxococcaceae bacterium]|nr:trypsin-like serine protease [Myxococcaceae bacterium]
MNRQGTWLVLTVWVVLMFLGCGGCEGRSGEQLVVTPTEHEAGWEVLEIPLEPAPPRDGNRLMELAGDVDVGNRYMAAVMITALSGGREAMACSGAAISRRVVLTAGHCVCRRQQGTRFDSGSQTMIDASACSEAAKVETIFYKPPVEEGTRSSGSLGRLYHGRVQPHPALEIVLDDQGRVSSSRADLALILLSKPLEFPGLPLADEAVRVGDSVIIVGYAYDEVANVFEADRRSSRNEVIRLMTAEDERVLIQQPRGHRYRQDSGGPCIRQGPQGPLLVGISSRWLGEGAAFTSIHGYRDWLRDAIQRAGTAPRRGSGTLRAAQ